MNKRTGEKVAIKKVLKPFRTSIECKRMLREIKLLRFLDNENIISIRDLLNPVNRHSFDSIYIVTELMDSDLQ